MAAFALAFSYALLLFALSAWALLGWGSLIVRLFRMPLNGAELVFSRLWLGLALTLLLLQLFNYFAPVNWIVTLIWLGGGVLAWWRRGRQSLNLPTSQDRRLHLLLYLLAILLSAGWIAMQSMQPATAYDTGLYHLQTIRWYNEYAIVPGLGNLYGRLAYNESFLAFAAVLNVYPFFNHGYALANGFLILLLAAEGWYALIFQRGAATLSRFATICMLPVAAYLVLRLNPASPSPITAATVLQLVIWLHFARSLEQRFSIYEAITRAHIIFILAVTAITIQLSSALFVLAIALIVLVRTWFVEVHPLFIKFIILFRLTWLALLILVIWMGRGYFLSGYPLYPLTQGGFAVDWAVPPYSARAEAESIAYLAKYGDESTVNVAENRGQRNWVGPWFQRQVQGNGLVALLYPFTLAFLLFLVDARMLWTLRKKQTQPPAGAAVTPSPPSYLLLLLPIFLAVISWWLTTPNAALVYALFWLLPIIAAHKLLVTLDAAGMGRPRLQYALAFVLVNCLIFFALALSWRQAVTLLPGFSALPRANVIEESLPPRLNVLMPVHDQRCWNAQLPCSPYINPQLRQRGSELRHGFQVMPQFEEWMAGLQH